MMERAGSVSQAACAAAAAAMAALDAGGMTISVHKNGEICAQGDVSRHVYRVMQGCVRIVKLLADGRRQVTEFLMPGDWFGIESVGDAAGAVEAVSDSVLRRFKRRHVDEMMENYPGLASWRLGLVSDKLCRAQERLLTLGRRTAAERIAVFLVEMEVRMRHDRSGAVMLPMNRGDIGDHLGLTVETVSRNLSIMEHNGAIGRIGSGFVIRDREALGDCVNLALN